MVPLFIMGIYFHAGLCLSFLHFFQNLSVLRELSRQIGSVSNVSGYALATHIFETMARLDEVRLCLVLDFIAK